MDKKYYSIHFQFKGVPRCEIIDKETLEKDANEVEDYWGTFAFGDKFYQFQLHYHRDKIRVWVFNCGGFDVLETCDAVITEYTIGQPIYEGWNSNNEPNILF